MSDAIKLKSILQTLFWLGVEAGLDLAERENIARLRVEDVHDAIVEAKRDDAIEDATRTIRRLFE